MKIRYALPEDLGELRRMAALFHSASCYADTVPVDMDSFVQTVSELASTAHGVVLVSENDDGKVCGMAGGVINPHWFNRNHLVGQELFWWVDADARGMGAGFGLMKALEDWAKEQGCNTFCMASTANLSPEKLAKVYKRRGYVPQDIFYAKVMNHA